MKTKYFKQAYGSFRHMTCFFLLAILLGFTAPAEAGLSAAGAYNVFVFGNADLQSDSHGSMAIGGDANLTSYGAASTLSGSDARLVVGGSLNAIGGRVGTDGGGTIYTPSLKPTVTITHAATDTLVNSGFEFNSAKKELNNFSERLAGMNDRLGSMTYEEAYTYNANGLLSLTGNDNELNVFNVLGSEFNSSGSDSISGFFIDAPKGSTVLINITGNVESFKNDYFNNGSLIGVGASDVLYNFCDDTGFDLYSGVQGSILAPKSDVNFVDGQLNGQIVANNLNGRGQYHLQTFTGTIPTPIPGSLLLFGTGLIGLVSIKRRRNR